MKYLQCFYFLVVLCHFSDGQESIHKVFSKQDGLVSNTVYDIRQDKLGFIWLATDLGLSRFDGRSFKNFPIEGNKSASISNILFSEMGEVWVQNFNGQFFKTEVDRLIYQDQLSKLGNFNLGHDFDGKKIAALGLNEIRFFDHQSKDLSTIKIPKALWISAINSTTNTFYLNDLATGKIIQVFSDGSIRFGERKTPFKNEYLHWLIDADDEYFVAKLQKKVYSKKREKVYDFSKLLPDAFVQNACLVAKQQIAILTTNGVILFDAQSGQFKRIFSKFSCSKLLEDAEGNWWITTLGDGCIFVPHREATVYLEGNEISSFQQAGSTIYFGTKNNCIYRYGIQSKELELIQQNSENHEVKSVFFNEKRNELLFCSVTFHKKTANQPIQNLPISVNQIVQLDKDHYLLCESNNLSIFPVKKGEKWSDWLKENRTLNQDRLALSHGNRRFLSAIYYQDQIIARASDGLWLFGKNEHKKLSVGKKNTDVIDLFLSPTGVLITTSDNGLFRFADGKITQLKTISEQLKGQRFYKTKYFENKYYVLTYAGTFVFDSGENFIQQVMHTDGYPNVDIIDFAVINGVIYASTTNGFQIIPLPNPSTRKMIPKVLLNSFSVNGEQMSFENKMQFSPDENSLHFYFSMINYRALGKNLLYYSVNGKKWTIAEEGKLQFNELAPGKYAVQVFAVPEQQRNRSAIMTLKFEILAPFYQTWWFISLLVFSLILIGLMVFRWRIKQIQQKNQILQEKLSLEKQLHESSLSAIKSQMNPHFLFNALNTIQSFIYTNEKEAASSYLVDFSELTRKVLEMSNQPFVLFSEEIEALHLYLKLEKMRFEDDFEFTLNTKQLPHESFQIPSMLIQPYVENAIKHGLLHKKGEKRIELQFSLMEKMLQVSIKDNGIGLKASKKINEQRNPNHQSFATAANQKRFELLNQLTDGAIGVNIEEILDTENKVVGTSVHLSIPVKL